MKRDHKAMAIDAQTPFNTDQIWNQPAYAYTLNRYEKLSEKEAANLVAKGKREGDLEKYKWNDNALLKMHQTIKDALDPKGILAPGKSGIWPKRLREGRQA